MATIGTTGSLVTFYSWKGGVGRSVALANTAVQLARRGRKVLMVDWDLEAPGLDRYFIGEPFDGREKLSIEQPVGSSGLLGLLCELDARGDGQVSSVDWESRLVRITVPRADPTFRIPTPPTPGRLDLLVAGDRHPEYADKLSKLNWDRIFYESRGDEALESLRASWAAAYDFVLIDARTGVTDNGGICTIQFPETLVLVFTANDQSLTGGLKVVYAAQQARREFPRDRPPLMVIPLLSRWNGEDEVDLSEQWLNRMSHELRELTSAWLPKDFTPRQFLEKLRVPHVARFSFGEPLPVITHSLTDTNLPGMAYDTLARLLDTRMRDAGAVVDSAYELPRFRAGLCEESELKMLAIVLDERILYAEIARYASQFGDNSTELSDFLNDAGLKLRLLHKNIDAERLYRRSLSIAESIHGPEHPEVAIRLNNLAQVLSATNRLAESEMLMRRALSIDEQSLGPEHPDVATDLNNLAELLRETNRLAEAEPLYRRALSIDERSIGPDDPAVAIGLNNLAELLRQTNRLAEAEPLFRRALSIDEQSYGPDHPAVATVLNNLAGLLQDTNRPTEAEPLYRRALTIDEQSFGPEHPEVATDLNNLAVLLYALDRKQEAEPLLQRAIEIGCQFSRTTGHVHPQLKGRVITYRQLLEELGNSENEIEEKVKKAGVQPEWLSV